MLDEVFDRFAAVLADHDVLVIVIMLLATAVVGAGAAQLDTEAQTDIDDDAFRQTDVGTALEYVADNYEDGDEETVARSNVYVRPEDGNALSRLSLATALEYQEAVLDDPTVQRELATDDAVRGPATLVGTRLAGENATVTERRRAVETADEEELEAAIRAALSDPTVAGTYLPASYEPGSTTAESFRFRIIFEQDDQTRQQQPLPNETAQAVLFDAAGERPSVFTLGTVAESEWTQQQVLDAFWLIVPPALVLVLAVLAIAYRNVVDVLLGFLGVIVSVTWFFGILGWLGIPAGFASIVGPVLIVALSIDFGLHVFMRHREQRSDGAGVRAGMRRAVGPLMVAFTLVAVTAAAGFLANVTSPIGFIRAFGVVITLGVFAAAVVFVTLIPALKLRIDETLESVGFDRRATALGTGGRLRDVLSVGVRLAERGAVVVVVVAVLAGAAGVVSYAGIDRQGFQQDFTDEDDWQTDIPEPFGWSAHETTFRQQQQYVQSAYQSGFERDRFTAMLVRGDVNDSTALRRVYAGRTAAADSDAAFQQGGAVPAVSPLTLLRSVAVEDPRFAALLTTVAEEDQAFDALLDELAADDEEFAAALDSAPEDPPPQYAGDDVPAVYDALYRAAPDEASRVIERRDGEYRSLRLLVPVEQGLDLDEQGDAMHGIADEMEGDTDLDVVPIGAATVSNAGLGAIADSILQAMVLAFLGVALVLALVYRFERGYASLGLVTVAPIVLVVGLVFGGMFLFGIPLTFITAFLVSITVGLGVDYAIHVSDRFALELDRGRDPIDALETTVTGTGGALFGSALTSGASFSTLMLHPAATFRSFGFIVVAALVLSFVASVLVFPSVLVLWARRVYGPESTVGGAGIDGAADAPRTCRNCGRIRTDVRDRTVVAVESGALDVPLCAACDASRKTASDECAGVTPGGSESNEACECCGRASVPLDVHAVVPPEGRGHRHDENIVHLCGRCHDMAHSKTPSS